MQCRRVPLFRSRLRIQARKDSAMRLSVLLFLIGALGDAQTGFVRNSILRPYEAKPVPPVSFQNSERIFDLMRAGQIYLSLADAIALALENNLDIELERDLPRIAQTDIQRAKGGGL